MLGLRSRGSVTNTRTGSVSPRVLAVNRTPQVLYESARLGKPRLPSSLQLRSLRCRGPGRSRSRRKTVRTCPSRRWLHRGLSLLAGHVATASGEWSQATSAQASVGRGRGPHDPRAVAERTPRKGGTADDLSQNWTLSLSLFSPMESGSLILHRTPTSSGRFSLHPPLGRS